MITLYYKTFSDDQSVDWHPLLSELLQKQGICSAPVLTGAYGKPYFADGPFFSISHTKQNLVMAISDSPIGVDLEIIRAVSDRVPGRVLSATEHQWYQGRGCLQEDFIRLWTLKESYYKYLGIGLPGYPNGTEFQNREQWTLKGSHSCFYCYRDDQLLTSVCSGKEDQIIRYFL